MDLDPEDAAFIRSVTPDGCVPLGMVAAVYYLDPETSEPHTASYMNLDDIGATAALGMVELTKYDVLRHYRCGPFDDYHGDDEE